VGVSLDVEPITPKRIALGQEPHSIQDTLRLVYSAKFLCGTIKHGANPQLPAGNEPLVPGTYMTAINIHNPYHFPVRFTKKALITNPQNEHRGRVGQPREDTLNPNEGLEVDCADIYKLLDMTPSPEDSFLKGFVVITSDSRIELDVVAVYTVKNVVVK
jgi:hypothetical protein